MVYTFMEGVKDMHLCIVIRNDNYVDSFHREQQWGEMRFIDLNTEKGSVLNFSFHI